MQWNMQIHIIHINTYNPSTARVCEVCVSARARAAGQRGITWRHNAPLKALVFDGTVYAACFKPEENEPDKLQ